MQQLETSPGLDPAASRPVSLAGLVLLFTRVGLTSFGGGVSAWIYREVVERRRWLNEDEALSALTMSQILPGSNVVNLSIYIGHRLGGTLGSVIAVAALLLPPMIVVVLLNLAIGRFSDIGWMHDFLEGLAAAAIGLTASVGLRGARRSMALCHGTVVLIVALFIAIGVLGWPLVPVVVTLTACSLILAYKKA